MKTLGYIQTYILTNNAFPTHAEQQTFLIELIKKYPHANDVTDLISRVSIFLIALLSGEYLEICLTYPNYLRNIQYKQIISQTRSKSKEHVQNYLVQIFHDRSIDSSGRISDPNIKESRAKALADLARDDRFIWEPPVFELNNEGEIVQENGNPKILQHARAPFTGPYIRNAIRYLFLEVGAEWKSLSNETFSAPQLAFVVTLVCMFISGYFEMSLDILVLTRRIYIHYQLHHICSDIKGTFSSGSYRAQYQNYLNRIQARIQAKKLDLGKFFDQVLAEVKKTSENAPLLDDDENVNWAL